MSKIVSAGILVLVLSVGASADPQGKAKGWDGKGGDTVTVPEPSGMPELLLSGAAAGVLAIFLRRKMAPKT